ncbi:Phosphopentomutase [Caprobacter fermentans]|uniref:Phosphopentomutase n=1 Tax=Caproicibacter fermentans TaxID=2576756 RepID=A0A6N8I3E7_9FIRM|nr:phosphopentomutase [Caproicibacter fermentans]MVB12033.1 Phosphopentomutase [Caproicibacter fermentans]OCN03031.1 phosphopentomutase [Clostridium sp. W14A]QNK40631.1 phosphopentomutase [Caproicibacter fermentans]
MKKFIIVVLDGFGVGQMEDVPQARPQDTGANTWLHILENKPELRLPVLEKLGLMNIIGTESSRMKFSSTATFGKAGLMHSGADTFFGHQEIVGTKPQKPFGEPIKNRIELIHDTLVQNGYHAEYYQGESERMLVVENALTVADNVECDPGQAFNVTAAIDTLDFDEVLKIGKLVRSVSKVPRVITFGGRGVTIQDILAAVEEHDGGYIGVNAPKSGVYNRDYHCIHLGYGVDPEVQVPTILGRAGYGVTLLGKAADVIQNPFGKSCSIVETSKVLGKLIELSKETECGFFCCNVQETDLAGHQESVEKYAHILEIADPLLGQLMDSMGDEDLLVVMADHGNDPTIGHPHHTREHVPLMIYGRGIRPGNLGIRGTLSDVGATATDYFGEHPPENGSSFLPKLLD